MKKICLYAIVLAFIANIHGVANAQSKKWTFSAFTTLDCSNTRNTDYIKTWEKLAPGAGLQVNYSLTEKWEVVTGVSYIDKGHYTKYKGLGPNDGPMVFVNNYWLSYLAVPVQMQYNIISDNFRHYYFGIGISNDFSFGNTKSYRSKPFAQSMLVNMGFDFTWGKKWVIGLEPTFRYYLYLYADEVVYQQSFWIVEEGWPALRPYSVGLKVRVSKNNSMSFSRLYAGW